MLLLLAATLIQEPESPRPFRPEAPVVAVGIPEAWKPAPFLRGSRLLPPPQAPRLPEPSAEAAQAGREAGQSLRKREVRRAPYILLELGLRILVETLRH